MLEVAVWVYGKLAGSYRLIGNEAVWEGPGRDPFTEVVRKPEGDLIGPILATDDFRDGWIGRGADDERWLRRLPGFLAMRGHMSAAIVRESPQLALGGLHSGETG